jgi:YD repeat-containing protein
VVHVFDGSGRHLRSEHTLSRSVVQQFDYDAAGRLRSVRDRNGLETVIERAADGRPLAIVAPGGQRTSLAVDAGGYLSAVTNPAGQSTTFESTPDGLLTRLQEPAGSVHTFEYDGLGRLIRDNGPEGVTQTLTRNGSSADYSVTLESALGHQTVCRTARSRDGTLTKTFTTADGFSSTVEHRPTGRRVVTSPDGSRSVAQRAPDPRFGFQSPYLSTGTMSMPSGLTLSVAASRTVTLGGLGALQSQTELVTVNGRTVRTSYDVPSRTLAWTSPSGRSAAAIHDTAGRPVELRLAVFPPASYVFESRGRV